MPKLTKSLVEKAEPRKTRYMIFDEQLPGFCLSVSPNGRRFYYLQYMKNKRVKRMSIGMHGILTTEEARDQAIKLLAEVKSGGDPQRVAQEKRQEPYMDELCERYMDEHVAIHCKPRTQAGYAWLMKKFIKPYFRDMKVSEVTRADVAAFHHKMRNSPYNANRALEMISKMFQLAELWGLRPDHSNPRRLIKKYPMKSRERYLSKEEAKRLGAVLDELKQYPDQNLAAVYCIQLLLLTGCRLSEIQTLKWEYYDRDSKTLRLPDSKTGAKTVYIGAAVINLLAEIEQHPARPKDNPYVIWGKKPGMHIKDIQNAWQRFRKQAEIEDVRIHDLRHSFASFAVSQGMSIAMIGRLLGHTQVQTTARYAHLMAEPMKQAATEVTGALGSLINVDNTAEELPEPEQIPESPFSSIVPGTDVESPKYLTSDQAAAYLGVAPRLMENWRWRKCGPVFVKVGSRIRYRLADLDAYLQKS
ncbi:MAG: integrase [Alphaproteobacteria bacterium CG_4_10_14_0_8_um_filter_53_9]|nr:MAG: integrase [Alphaproteobacteria bacterium CG_4_10_14_0_8_um_filter_53_9]